MTDLTRDLEKMVETGEMAFATARKRWRDRFRRHKDFAAGIVQLYAAHQRWESTLTWAQQERESDLIEAIRAERFERIGVDHFWAFVLGIFAGSLVGLL